MNLSAILSALRAHRLIAGAVVLYVLLLTGAAATLPDDQFSATVTLVAQPTDPDNAGPVFSSLQYVMPQLATTAESRSVANAAQKVLAPALRSDEVVITAEGDPSGVLRITASSKDRRLVAPYANGTSAALRDLQASNRTAISLSELDRALVPDVPSGPPRTAIAVGGVVLALISGLFAALIAAALRRRSSLADEVSRRLGITILAEIPRLRGISARYGTGIEAMLVDDLDPRLIEALQRLRNGLELVQRGGRQNLSVTSVRAGEGKSTVAAVLSWSLASAGYEVLLIDADLRLPTQHVRFNVPLVPGLADLRATDLDSVAVDTGVERLRLLPAGASHRHPADVLASVLPTLTQAQNGTLIVDTPPLEGVAETLRVTVTTGQVLLVADAPTLQPEELERQVVRLREAGVEIVGIVLNRSRMRQAARGYDPYAPSRARRERRFARLRRQPPRRKKAGSPP